MRGPHVRFCERKEVGNLFPTFTYSINFGKDNINTLFLGHT
jgi:hypothetical protein